MVRLDRDGDGGGAGRDEEERTPAPPLAKPISGMPARSAKLPNSSYGGSPTEPTGGLDSPSRRLTTERATANVEPAGELADRRKTRAATLWRERTRADVLELLRRAPEPPVLLRHVGTDRTCIGASSCEGPNGLGPQSTHRPTGARRRRYRRNREKSGLQVLTTMLRSARRRYCVPRAHLKKRTPDRLAPQRDHGGKTGTWCDGGRVAQEEGVVYEARQGSPGSHGYPLDPEQPVRGL